LMPLLLKGRIHTVIKITSFIPLNSDFLLWNSNIKFVIIKWVKL